MVLPNGSTKKSRDFDPKKFLATIGEGRKVVAFSKKQRIFSQGDAADAILYIQAGKVRLTVVSKIGKEATLGILVEGEFFGEGGLAGQPLRMGSATAMTDCELLRIDKKAMMLALERARREIHAVLTVIPLLVNDQSSSDVVHEVLLAFFPTSADPPDDGRTFPQSFT
jgi:CRP/FNR family cyclic AMP-dependent transcriptional regulator